MRDTFAKIHDSILLHIYFHLKAADVARSTVVNRQWARHGTDEVAFWTRVTDAWTHGHVDVALHSGSARVIFQEGTWLLVSPWMDTLKREGIIRLLTLVPSRNIRMALGADWEKCGPDICSMIGEAPHVIVIHQINDSLPEMTQVRRLVMDEASFYTNPTLKYGDHTRIEVYLNHVSWEEHITLNSSMMHRVDTLFVERPLVWEDFRRFRHCFARTICAPIEQAIEFHKIEKWIKHSRDFRWLQRLAWVKYKGNCVRDLTARLVDWFAVLSQEFRQLYLLWDVTLPVSGLDEPMKKLQRKCAHLRIAFVIRGVTASEVWKKASDLGAPFQGLTEKFEMILLAFHEDKE